jgi:TBC1 domain family protein 5
MADINMGVGADAVGVAADRSMASAHAVSSTVVGQCEQEPYSSVGNDGDRDEHEEELGHMVEQQLRQPASPVKRSGREMVTVQPGSSLAAAVSSAADNNDEVAAAASDDGPHITGMLSQINSLVRLEQLVHMEEQLRRAAISLTQSQFRRLSDAFSARSSFLRTVTLSEPEIDENFRKNEASATAVGLELEVISTEPTADDAQEQEPQPPTKTMVDRWDAWFGSPTYDAALRDKALNGGLHICPFRSVCWRIFLTALPSDKTQWAAAVAESRAGALACLKSFDLDPHQVPDKDNLSLNNPLSQDDDSPWQQYFHDAELKKTIQQDVARTYPELDWFQIDEAQAHLLKILFSWCKACPNVAYCQGMHELLAPLYFVIVRDAQLVNPDDATSDMLLLLDRESVVADAYHLFSKLMEIALPWYISASDLPSESKQKESLPFAVEDQQEPSSEILVKLSRVHNTLVRAHDPELHHRLQALDIPPQIYGLRWVRLFFSREFPLRETMQLWDAIFTGSPFFGLVDYLSVAMLVYVCDFILCHSYSDCLRLLLKYPHMEDVSDMVNYALYLQTPMVYPKPMYFSFGTVNDETPPRKLLQQSLSQHSLLSQQSLSSQPQSRLSLPGKNMTPKAFVSSLLSRKASQQAASRPSSASTSPPPHASGPSAP